jgi:hypothetical protein
MLTPYFVRLARFRLDLECHSRTSNHTSSKAVDSDLEKAWEGPRIFILNFINLKEPSRFYPLLFESSNRGFEWEVGWRWLCGWVNFLPWWVDLMHVSLSFPALVLFAHMPLLRRLER